ncbi:MAG: decaprenyl-phosphate phosphoribosyltransferase [Anaerolineaceae bacterium]|nr:decaprenyl-phosphate phosphoribosyltransferase [Anaerolineaceae bacterium]
MIRDILKSMRPKQWVKNVFVLPALVFDRQLFNIPALLRTGLGFILFCLLSSAIYLLNDIADIESDRKHPRKKNRPIAAGRISVKFARIFAIFLLLIVFVCGYFLSKEFLLIALLYWITNTIYSKWLKHQPILDAITLSMGFLLRVFAGVSLIEVERFSPWLYVVATLISLYIVLGKRRSELNLISNTTNEQRPVLDGYTIPFLDQLISIISATTIISYSLYTFSAPNVPANHTMMLTIPFVIYGIFRYLHIMQVQCKGDTPEEIFLHDRPLQIVMALWAFTVVLIFYFT